MDQLPPIPTESSLLIETDRLELRPILRDDAQLLFPVLSDPALYEHTGDEPPASVSALRELYASREARRSPGGRELWLNWMIRIGASGEAIGYMQASVAPRRADLAWVIGSPWQSRGYASEAAKAVIDWLWAIGVTRIRASINPHHAASRKVAINAGLRRTDEFSEGEEAWVLEAAR
ncbi:MAG: GNAT family N-acetyltransferase [Planctomycetota bacterium]|nr:GNAT family N-acetyltransferase [Planctomycetota bacterium]